MGVLSGEVGNVLVSLWSVVSPPSVVLCGLMAGDGRTGAVGGAKPCCTERFLSQSFLLSRYRQSRGWRPTGA
jgi:hypothetical protein